MSGRLLGEGRSAEVFDRGDHVLKLYRAGAPRAVPEREAVALGVARREGVRAPQPLGVVEEDGRWGLAMSHLRGPSLGSFLGIAPAAQMDDGLRAMARLQARLHGLSGAGLASLRERLEDRVGRAPGLSPRGRARLLRRLDELPLGDRLCHGDLHPFNLVVPDPAADPAAPLDGLGVLDWPDARSGAPSADACRTLILMDTMGEAGAARWLAAFRAESGQDAATVLAWRPVVAAARLVEEVERPEAERLRAWAEGA